MFGALQHTQRLNFQLPVLGPLLSRRANAQYRADAALMANVVDEVIRARRDSGEPGTTDLLGLMLDTAHQETGQRLDEVNIRNQVITFLVAGHETTSCALAFALYYLATEPAVLARARAEVDAVWGDQEDPMPSFEQVGKLRYVRRVLDEALRLWPTAPGFARQARADTTLAGHYPIREGQWVLVLAPLLRRDPVWGDDVDSFDPDRFAPDRVKARPAHAYKPFGTGERACIGRQFAIHEAVLALGAILHRFGFEADPGYRLKVKELLTLRPDGFTLRLGRRPVRVPEAATSRPARR